MKNILLTEEQFRHYINFKLNEAFGHRGWRLKGNLGQKKNKETVVGPGDDGFGPKIKGFKMTDEIADTIVKARDLFYPDINNDGPKLVRKIENSLIKQYGEDKYYELLETYINKFEQYGIMGRQPHSLVGIRKVIGDCCTTELNKDGEINHNPFKDKAYETGKDITSFMNTSDFLDSDIIDKYLEYKYDIRDDKVRAAFNPNINNTQTSDDTTFNAYNRRTHATSKANENVSCKFVNKKREIKINVLLDMFKDIYKPKVYDDNETYKAEIVYETNNNNKMNLILQKYFSDSIQSGQQRTGMSITDKTIKKTGEDTKQYNYKLIFVDFKKAVKVSKISPNSDSPEWYKNQHQALEKDFGYTPEETIEILEPYITPKGFFVVTSTNPTPTQKIAAKQRLNNNP